MSVVPVQPLSASDVSAARTLSPPTLKLGASGPSSFVQMLSNGINHVDQKIAAADQLVNAFALDDSVPLHQVTYALQEARMSLEFMLQARTRLTDAYQQFAQMQL